MPAVLRLNCTSFSSDTDTADEESRDWSAYLRNQVYKYFTLREILTKVMKLSHRERKIIRYTSMGEQLRLRVPGFEGLECSEYIAKALSMVSRVRLECPAHADIKAFQSVVPHLQGPKKDVDLCLGMPHRVPAQIIDQICNEVNVVRLELVDFEINSYELFRLMTLPSLRSLKLQNGEFSNIEISEALAR